MPTGHLQAAPLMRAKMHPNSAIRNVVAADALIHKTARDHDRQEFRVESPAMQKRQRSAYRGIVNLEESIPNLDLPDWHDASEHVDRWTSDADSHATSVC